MITAQQAQRATKRYLLDKYPQTKINFGDCKFVALDNLPPFAGPIATYRLEGDFEVRPRGMMADFLYRRQGMKTSFVILVHATSSRILSWEFR